MFPLVAAFLMCLHGGQTAEDLVAQLAKGKDVKAEIVLRGGAGVVPLARLLHDEKADLVPRLDAALLLGKIGGNQVVGPLRKVLSDQTIHWAAAMALGTVGPTARDALP